MEQLLIILIQRIKKGDQQAFKALYLQFQNPIYAYALRFLKSKELAEELVQEVFMRVWKYRESLDEQGQISAYLYKIAQHSIYSQLKKASREKELRETLFSVREEISDIESEQSHNALLEVYARAVELLPERRKKVFEMSRNDNLSHEEIARVLDISKNTVKDQVTKASSFIRKYILIHQ